MKMKRLTIAIAMIGAGAVIHAQAAETVNKVERVEVTGSNIKRTAKTGATPVQVMSRQEIAKTGATTVAELVDNLASSNNGYAQAQAVGDSGKPGFSGANLRGLGTSKTLILVNGRRMANYAFDSAGVDLNSIPLGAVDRVEIVKDGASAVYGTDAIGGVMNFILKKNFVGAEIGGGLEQTFDGGGDVKKANFSFGFGNLDEDNYNVFMALDVSKQEALAAKDRSYSKTSYIPDKEINKTSANTFPATILNGPGGKPVNVGYLTGCDQPRSLPVANPNFATGGNCRFDYASIIDIVSPQERLSFYSKGTFKINDSAQVFADYLFTRNIGTYSSSPVPVSSATTFNGDNLLYPANGKYDPYKGTLGDLKLQWRGIDLGPRTNEATSDQHRFIVGAEGELAGWDYRGALVYASNKTEDKYTNGWVYESKLLPAMMSGVINPFGPQDAAGKAALEATKITGKVQSGETTNKSADIQFSKEIYELDVGKVGFAFGGDVRKETYAFTPEAILSGGDILGGGGNRQSTKGERLVYAGFAEMVVPILKNLELQAALRYDHYDDMGSTTNPKLSFRYQPIDEVVLRGSISTGYHAPTLDDLNRPTSKTNTGGSYDDPERCAATKSPLDCNLQLNLVQGGSKALTPELSTNYTFGFLVEPVKNISLGIDYWNINIKDRIDVISDATVFDNYAKYKDKVVRKARTAADIAAGLPGLIDYVDSKSQNLGELRTDGLDVSFLAATPKTEYGTFRLGVEGTYTISNEYQREKNGDFFDSVGQYIDLGMNPRWRHNLSLSWNMAEWGASLTNNLTSSYIDQNQITYKDPKTGVESQVNRTVEAYSTWGLQGTYRTKSIELTLGVKNLFDTDPPFTNQADHFQVGFDPKYTSPSGRSWYAKANYKF
ncbi:TonB-dependent receptor [Iodobacter arcticus]|uniref:TonB-dependent receptor n=1 Tax=Iodobacter arcticus TaxID=590593 RepID=A0ABW2R262_9NEIS